MEGGSKAELVGALIEELGSRRDMCQKTQEFVGSGMCVFGIKDDLIEAS